MGAHKLMDRPTGAHAKPVQQTSDDRVVIVMVVLALITVIVVSLIIRGQHGDHHSTPVSRPSATAAHVVAPTHHVAVQPVVQPKAKATPHVRHSKHHAAPTPKKPTLVYVVQSGDSLTAIAGYFHSHGYQPLYTWNKKIIGNDPNLIYPGQRLIVVPGSHVQKVVNT